METVLKSELLMKVLDLKIFSGEETQTQDTTGTQQKEQDVGKSLKTKILRQKTNSNNKETIRINKCTKSSHRQDSGRLHAHEVFAHASILPDSILPLRSNSNILGLGGGSIRNHGFFFGSVAALEIPESWLLVLKSWLVKHQNSRNAINPYDTRVETQENPLEESNSKTFLSSAEREVQIVVILLIYEFSQDFSHFSSTGCESP